VPWLASEFEQPYMQALQVFLTQEYAKQKNIYPEYTAIFQAFSLTPFDKVQVVIVGQDPYHGPNQAHGLCFSVQPGIPFPPSLKNIFKELKRDLGKKPKTGSLAHWAEQGVLLLNSVLTVEEGLAASHQKRGWEIFTDKVIHCLNEQKKGLVFVLWGKYAQQKCTFIDENKHLVLRSVHPSPLSAHRGFLGCGHFSSINVYLQENEKEPLAW
jgi:uracil-DNA glycosylase